MTKAETAGAHAAGESAAHRLGIRIGSLAIGTIAVFTTIWAAGPYAVWANRHDTLFENAAEVGKTPVYEPGHYVVGWALAASIAVVLIAVLVAATGIARLGTRARVLAVIAIVVVGAAVPAMVLSPAYGMPPMFLAVALGVRAAVHAERSTRAG
ncbi:MAG TPA: hypothetical protein VJR25_07470 [Microbacterium sp.]|uniref:hypothetical protein n=1 Tax=Microbacterium sp. TaxID=51671 RepID=UPI002B46E0B1|nr:hypothetical protein [Microbacterium sp.]HKT56594.1 hypothetical protein [Microbacterium sp.]